jgi:hypothetical protein
MQMLIHFIYIDPGSGSLLFQALLSSLLTGVVFFKKITTYIKGLFTRKSLLKEKELS